MKAKLNHLFIILIGMYILIELMTLSKAFSLLYGNVSPMLLNEYRPIALSTVGIGITILFIQFASRLYQSEKNKRVLAISLTCLPMFFIGGQIIAMWISDNAQNVLSDSGKQAVVNAAFYKMEDKHTTFFPALFESDARSHTITAKQAQSYLMTIDDKQYSRILSDHANALRQMAFNYSDKSPSKNQWYLAQRAMQKRLDLHAGEWPSQALRVKTSLRPPSLSPLTDAVDSAMLLSMNKDMTFRNIFLLQAKLNKYRHGYLTGKNYLLTDEGERILREPTDIDMQYAVRYVLNIDRTVTPYYNDNVVGKPVPNLLWTEQLSDLVPNKGYVTAIDFGMSREKFLSHPFVLEVVSTHMPFFYYDGEPLVKMSTFANAGNLMALNRHLSPLSAAVKSHSARLWGKSINEQSKNDTAFEVPIYANIMAPQIAMAFSVPLIAIISSILLLANIYQYLIMNKVKKKTGGVIIASVVLAFLILPIDMLSMYINHLFESAIPWLADSLHTIGLKQDAF